jgi:hypothetical protein
MKLMAGGFKENAMVDSGGEFTRRRQIKESFLKLFNATLESTCN